MTHNIIPAVSTNTAYRILSEVKKSGVGILDKFENAAVDFSNNPITQILDTLWNYTIGFFSSKKERLADEKEVKINFGRNLFNAIKNSTGETAHMRINEYGIDTFQKDYKFGYDTFTKNVYIDIKTENGNIYFYDLKEPHRPHLLIEGTTLEEYRSLCNGNIDTPHKVNQPAKSSWRNYDYPAY